MGCEAWSWDGTLRPPPTVSRTLLPPSRGAQHEAESCQLRPSSDPTGCPLLLVRAAVGEPESHCRCQRGDIADGGAGHDTAPSLRHGKEPSGWREGREFPYRQTRRRADRSPGHLPRYLDNRAHQQQPQLLLTRCGMKHQGPQGNPPRLPGQSPPALPVLDARCGRQMPPPSGRRTCPGVSQHVHGFPLPGSATDRKPQLRSPSHAAIRTLFIAAFAPVRTLSVAAGWSLAPEVRNIPAEIRPARGPIGKPGDGRFVRQRTPSMGASACPCIPYLSLRIRKSSLARRVCMPGCKEVLGSHHCSPFF